MTEQEIFKIDIKRRRAYYEYIRYQEILDFFQIPESYGLDEEESKIAHDFFVLRRTIDQIANDLGKAHWYAELRIRKIKVKIYAKINERIE